jgi:ABC-type transport system involved in multi-copper enzyme maturation permease subunit
MFTQTISLFRYLMLGILSRRLFVLLTVLVLAAVLTGSFIDELAIINGKAIVGAFIADFLRYSLALLTLLMIATSVAEDYESRQFERLLTMPLARWQYIAAQTLVIVCLCLLLVLPVLLLVSVYGGLEIGLYWAAALWLELFLLGLLGLLAILSLEKIPQAVFFSLAIYLLAKLSGLIVLMLAESVRLSDGSATSRAMEFIFGSILYLIPGTKSFADSDVFFGSFELLTMLGEQLATVLVYALFILAVCLVDFYRKEFNL